MSRHVVGLAAEILPGQHQIFEINGRSIGVFNLDGEFFALLNRCPHEGGPLCSGTVTGLRQSTTPGEYRYSRPGEILRCPWHGWEFDIKTGQSWFDPAGTRVRPYPVRVETGASGYQPGPYQAETFEVAVEDEYLVVEVGS
jgi:3-phenylpropionate/trans-cinnamate dioxygenase ferredoxin subunit